MDFEGDRPCPDLHRLRWADLFGTGKKVLVNAVLTSATAEPPGYEGDTPLYFYDPKDWKRQSNPVDKIGGVVHGIIVDDWNGDGKSDVLTAGFTGIDVYQMEGQVETRGIPRKARPPDWPKGGSSDIVNRPRRSRASLVAAVEPWHGNMVAVYTGRRA